MSKKWRTIHVGQRSNSHDYTIQWLKKVWKTPKTAPSHNECYKKDRCKAT